MSTCLDQLWLDLHPEFFKPPPAPDKAHPYAPGTGPRGQTCGTCDKCIAFTNDSDRKRWFKCRVLMKNWTHGAATDIRKKDPACKSWEPRTDKIEFITTRGRGSPNY